MSDTRATAEAEKPAETSQGQLALEMLLAVLNRLAATARRLHEVRAATGAAKTQATPAAWPAAGPHATAKPPETKFFPALAALTAELDRAAGELETGVEDLAKLF